MFLGVQKMGAYQFLDCFKGYLGFEFWQVALSFSHRTLLCLEILTKGVVRFFLGGSAQFFKGLS